MTFYASEDMRGGGKVKRYREGTFTSVFKRVVAQQRYVLSLFLVNLNLANTYTAIDRWATLGACSAPRAGGDVAASAPRTVGEVRLSAKNPGRRTAA